MCGIIGFNFQDKDFLKKALKEINHRGPDASGTYTDKKISLGHKRLSIIDLSKKGKQPMSNEKEDVWIIFNGEIYNFKQLKKVLTKKHNFKSNTDTELLIHLYEEQGTNMLDKLQGMFAFCIYDMKKNILFLARDRIGIKPLYYYKKNKKFVFCSEIKGILKNKEIKREIELDALSSFLIFRANTLEKTIFNNIKKLMPGNFLIYNLKTSNMGIKKYWDLPRFTLDKSQSFFTKKLKILLEDSVKSRLMSDVPYGAYLSGGVDSGTVVSLMNKFSTQTVNTFSVGFEQEEHTETREAGFLAEKLNTNHHELLISEKSIRALPDIVYHSDEPMSDPTSIPIYFLSKFTKKYSTVILTGEGADEVFAGYPQYKFMKAHKLLLRKTPVSFRKIVPQILKNSPPGLLDKGFRFSSSLGQEGIQRFSNFINSNDYAEQYLNQDTIFNKSEQEDLLNLKIDLYKKYQKYFANSNNKNIVSKCQKLDFKEPMVDKLLMKIDKNTMKFAIEGRVPFLDHRIAELGFKIPDKFKLRGFAQDKYILRQTVKNMIPKQTVQRKKKHFFVPIDSWFKNELRNVTESLLSETFIKKQKIFNYHYIRKIKENFKKSRLFYSRQLWSLIVFQIWYKMYIEKEDGKNIIN